MSEITVIDENQDQMPITKQDNQAQMVSPWFRLMEQSIDKGTDIAMIEKFVELQHKEEERQQERDFNDALSELQTRIPKVEKSGEANFKLKSGAVMTYNFDKLNDVCNAVRPILMDVGLSYSWDQKQEGEFITVRCTIKHRNGHSVSNQLTAKPDATGNKNVIQQVASTVTYLQRYTLKSALGISSEEADDDGNGANIQTAKQDQADFLRWMATAKKELASFSEQVGFEDWYKQAIAYSSQYNPKFTAELEQEYTSLKQQRGWK